MSQFLRVPTLPTAGRRAGDGPADVFGSDGVGEAEAVWDDYIERSGNVSVMKE